MNKIERHTAVSVDDYAEMMADSVGQWVSYREHEQIVNKLERELEEYKQEVAVLQEQLREAGLL